MNKYLTKIASLAEIPASLGRVAGKAVGSTAKYVSNTVTNAMGAGKMEFLDKHLFKGKGNEVDLMHAKAKFGDLSKPENLDKLHAEIKRKHGSAPEINQFKSEFNQVKRNQLDDKVRSGIIAGGTYLGAKHLKDRLTNPYGEYQ